MQCRLFDANVRFQYGNLEDVELSNHRDSHFAHWLHEYVGYVFLEQFLVNCIIYHRSYNISPDIGPDVPSHSLADSNSIMEVDINDLYLPQSVVNDDTEGSTDSSASSEDE